MDKDVIGLNEVQIFVNNEHANSVQCFKEYPIPLGAKWVEIVRSFLARFRSGKNHLEDHQGQKSHAGEVLLRGHSRLVLRRVVETRDVGEGRSTISTITFSPDHDDFSAVCLESSGESLSACTVRGEVDFARLVALAIHMSEIDKNRAKVRARTMTTLQNSDQSSGESPKTMPVQTILDLLWLYAKQSEEKVFTNVLLKVDQKSTEDTGYKVVLQKYAYSTMITEQRFIPGSDISVSHQVTVQIPGYRLQIVIGENIQDIFVPADFLFNPSAQVRYSNAQIIPQVIQIVAKLVATS